MQLTSFAPVTSMLWKYLESCDIEPAPLYKKAGIDPELWDHEKTNFLVFEAKVFKEITPNGEVMEVNFEAK